MFEQVDDGHTEGEETIHYYYNREERLKNAPQIVKDYYDGKMKPVRGLKVLVANPANRIMLFSLVFFIAVAWIYSGFNRSRNYAKIAGLDCELTAFSYAEELYISLSVKKNPKAKEEVQNQLVQAELSLVNADNAVTQIYKDNLAFEGKDDFIRTKFTDYDIIRVDALVTAAGQTKELSCSVKR